MCVNEGLRMFPPGVLLDRICNKECTVQGVKIPEGVGISFHVVSVFTRKLHVMANNEHLTEYKKKWVIHPCSLFILQSSHDFFFYLLPFQVPEIFSGILYRITKNKYGLNFILVVRSLTKIEHLFLNETNVHHLQLLSCLFLNFEFLLTQNIM